MPSRGKDKATMPPVLNQGKFGTCVAHAFAQALSQGLLSKYGVPCDAGAIVQTVKALCPCWNGHQTERMPEEWNKRHNDPGATIEDVDKRKRYRVKVNFRKVDLFTEAYCELERAEELKTYMPCTITTSIERHDRHSVALASCIDGKMEALNSWGANEVFKDVTPENFVFAITFDAEITAAWEGNVTLPRPKPMINYTRRVQQFEASMKMKCGMY